MALLAIFAGLIGARGADLVQHVRVNQAAHRIAKEIKFTKFLAIRYQADITLVMEKVGPKLRIQRLSDEKLPFPRPEKITAGTVFSFNDEAIERFELSYFSNGIPSKRGKIQLQFDKFVNIE